MEDEQHLPFFFVFLIKNCYLCIRKIVSIMIVKVSERSFHPDEGQFGGYVVDNEYDLELPDEKIIGKITTKFPTYWYALIDGKLFKSDQRNGLKSIYFSSEDDLKARIADALYWRKGLVPRIGQGVGYDIDDFYKKLIKTHNVEFKQVQF